MVKVYPASLLQIEFLIDGNDHGNGGNDSDIAGNDSDNAGNDSDNAGNGQYMFIVHTLQY